MEVRPLSSGSCIECSLTRTPKVQDFGNGTPSTTTITNPPLTEIMSHSDKDRVVLGGERRTVCSSTVVNASVHRTSGSRIVWVVVSVSLYIRRPHTVTLVVTLSSTLLTTAMDLL